MDADYPAKGVKLARRNTSEVAIHEDRHHFWTSVLRLLLTDAHRQKPSARYVEYLNARLNLLLSVPAAQWCLRAGL